MNTRLNAGKSRVLLVGGLLSVLALVVCFGMLGPKAVGAAPLGVPSGYNLVWSDEFDGVSLDTTKWTIGMKAPNGDMVPGAAGQYLLNTGYSGCIAPDDVYISSGSLVLRNQKRTYSCPSPSGTFQYTSGEVMSMNKYAFNMGYVEFRAQFPTGDKVWPALWLVASRLVWPPEMDLWEYFGYRPDQGYDNMENALCVNSAQHWYGSHLANFNATYGNGSWHVYGWQWTATQMIWSIDGTQVSVINKSSLQSGDQLLWPNENFYFILNNGIRAASPDQSNWPNYTTIDYVRVYQSGGATPTRTNTPTGPTPTPTSTPSNRVSNPGFETGSLSPWTSWNNSVVNSNQHSGTYSMRVGTASGSGEQTISGLTANTTYTLKGWVKTSATSVQVNVGVKNFGGTETYQSSTSTSYTQKTVTFTTGSSNTSATIYCYKPTTSGYAYCDDFTLQ